MTLSGERESFTAKPLSFIEVDLDWVDDTVPAFNGDGTPCYKTPATTDNIDALTIGTRTRRYCDTTAAQVWDLDAIPCIDGIRYQTTQLKVGESLGSFGQVTITLRDFVDDDRLEDPFYSQRTHDTAAGTYFTKLHARNPYIQGRALRVFAGFAGEEYNNANFEERHYLIRSIKRTNKSSWQIIGVSPLQLANLRGAKAPKPSGWTLKYNIGLGSTTAELVDYSIADDDPTSGYCLISDEVCSYTRVNNVLNIARGQFATTPDSHDAGDGIQPALQFINTPVQEIIRTLLVDYAGVSPALIPIFDWNNESNKWLQLYSLSPLPITEPVDVIELINEICEQVGLFLWYDEIAQIIRLQAIRPVPTSSIQLVTDDDLVSEVAINPDVSARVSRVAMLYDKRTPIADDGKDASYRKRLIGRNFGDGTYEHGSESLKVIHSRWFGTNDDAVSGRTAFTIASTLRDGRTLYTFTLNKRRADLDLGNVISLRTRDAIDTTGQMKTLPAIIVKRTPAKDGLSVEYIAEPFIYAARFIYVLPNDHTTTYPNTPEATQDPGWFLASSDGTMPNGDAPYVLG